MNKTIVFLGILGFTIVGIAGVTVLLALGRDATPVIGFVGTTLTVVIAAALQLSSNQKIAQRQEHIAKSVNGNTTKLLGMIDKDKLTFDDQIALGQIEADNNTLANGSDYEPRHRAS